MSSFLRNNTWLVIGLVVATFTVAFAIVEEQSMGSLVFALVILILALILLDYRGRENKQLWAENDELKAERSKERMELTELAIKASGIPNWSYNVRDDGTALVAIRGLNYKEVHGEINFGTLNLRHKNGDRVDVANLNYLS